MARYNAVTIGSISFTSDGTPSGIPCKVIVNGIKDAFLTKAGQTIISANGVPWTQVVDVERRGLIFSFAFDFIDQDVHENIVTLFQDMIDNEDTEVLTISGDTGDYTFNVKPFIEDAFKEPSGFSGGIIKNIAYSVITT